MRHLAQSAKAQAARLVRAASRMRNAGTPHGVILIYHRIARPASDPWNMSVSPENFADHLDVIRRFGVPRSFADFAGRLDGTGKEQSVVVTFDDGYADNLAALPMLAAREVPATIFVISGAIGNPRAFWWDLLTRVFLETPTLPRELLLRAGGTELRHDLGDAARYDAADLIRSARWRADTDPPEDARQRIYLDVWAKLVVLAPDQIARAATALQRWAGLPDLGPAASDARPVTQAELERLAESPLIEIGGHTRTHADLSAVQGAQAATEIGGGRHDLMERTGRTVRGFAYPYGRFGPLTVKDIRDAGYSCAGNSRPGVATSRHDRLALPRLHATDLPGDQFEDLLSAYMAPR